MWEKKNEEEDVSSRQDEEKGGNRKEGARGTRDGSTKESRLAR